MKFTCIMTTFNDGPILRQSVLSILNQSFDDFEFLLVDDGSGPETQAILEEFDDPRLTVIPQANDGLSSARNRALQHAKGDYVCFLDGDDVRAPWAFATIAEEIERTGAELIFMRGQLSGERTKLEPFLDTPQADGFTQEIADGAPDTLATRKIWATAMEPQCANKFVSNALIKRAQLRFPNDHFFEDILFHTLCVAHAKSISFVDSPGFTYFRRALRPQLTGGSSQTRFDIIGTARVTLQLFEQLPDFTNVRQRGALMLSILRLVEWCESCMPSYHRFAFRTALRDTLKELNPLFFVFPENVPDLHQQKHRLETYAEGVLA